MILTIDQEDLERGYSLGSNKFVSYTCNKKNEPTMREDCMKCPEYNPCAQEGQWCFVGALLMEYENKKLCADATLPNAANMAAPVMRDMSIVPIYFGEGQRVDVLKEDIVKSLEQEFYKSVMIPKGVLNER